MRSALRLIRNSFGRGRSAVSVCRRETMEINHLMCATTPTRGRVGRTNETNYCVPLAYIISRQEVNVIQKKFENVFTLGNPKYSVCFTYSKTNTLNINQVHLIHTNISCCIIYFVVNVIKFTKTNVKFLKI